MLTTLALAQPAPIEQVVPLKQPPTPRIHLVVDVSGSVNPRIAEAFSAISALVEHPIDSMSIKVTAFSDTSSAWRPGNADKNGWVDSPGPNDLNAVKDWLKALPHGSTRLGPSLAAALAEGNGAEGAKESTPVTVVVISDGIFISDSHSTLVGLLSANASRKQEVGGPVPVIFFGVGNTNDSVLNEFGELGNGYVRFAK